MTIAIPEALANHLPSDIDLARCELTTYAELCKAHDVREDYLGDISDDAVVVILPGWSADDGNCAVEYPEIDDRNTAAQKYVDDGDWGEGPAHISVCTWRTAYALGEDDELVEMKLDRESQTVSKDEDEPECDADEHDWRSPHKLLGGLKENPGVWAHGGGVVIKEVCAHCGRYRVTDTWAQGPGGEQGLREVKYEDADSESLTWIRQRKAREICDRLSEYDDGDLFQLVDQALMDDPDVTDDQIVEIIRARAVQ